MKLTSKQYAQALYDSVTQTAPHDHDKVMNNFVKILATNGDLGKHQEIENEYRRLDMEAKGIKEAEVTVAREMEVNSYLMHQLNEIVGSKVEIKKKVDEGIVGGIIMKVDDMLIDASVRTQLNNLNRELKA